MGRERRVRPVEIAEVSPNAANANANAPNPTPENAPPARIRRNPEPNLDPAEVYQKVIEHEELEAKRRSAEKDAALFFSTCASLRTLFKAIDEHKSKSPKAVNPDDLIQMRNQASIHIVTLKKLNRLEKIRTKAGRDALHKEKQKLDSMHLLLQNLLYEAKHLDKQTTQCLQFKSKDEEIDLISVEEFYETAPDHVSRPSITKNNEFQLRIARLEWELTQRRELFDACNQLQKTSKVVSSSLSEARSRLAGLVPKLQDALVAAEPLREALGIKVSKNTMALQEPATLLPLPLFLLYARTLTFSEAFEQFTVNVSIIGDENEARQLQESGLPVLSDSDSDGEAKEEEESQVKKKRHRRANAKLSKREKAEERIRLVLKPHPLKVVVKVTLKGVTVVMTFSYLMNLKIITVESSMELPKQMPGVSSGDVLNSQNILNSLCPGDDGLESPHPATSHILKSYGMEGSFSQFISELGKPYNWAQRMCGLDFMDVNVPETKDKFGPFKVSNEPSPKLSTATVEVVLVEIHKHLKRRLRLMAELQELESGNLPPFEGTGGAHVKLMGSLTQWQAVSWAEYSQAASAANFIGLGLVSPSDMFYRAIITRQSAKIVALVNLKSAYPKQAPIFALTLHWNGTHHSKNNDDIRDVERCVNTECDDTDEDAKRITLAGQMTKLIACLDVLLEAMGSSEFPPDKIMLNPVRGRTRTKPYKFLKQGSGVFVQY